MQVSTHLPLVCWLAVSGCMASISLSPSGYAPAVQLANGVDYRGAEITLLPVLNDDQQSTIYSYYGETDQYSASTPLDEYFTETFRKALGSVGMTVYPEARDAVAQLKLTLKHASDDRMKFIAELQSPCGYSREDIIVQGNPAVGEDVRSMRTEAYSMIDRAAVKLLNSEKVHGVIRCARRK